MAQTQQEDLSFNKFPIFLITTYKTDFQFNNSAKQSANHPTIWLKSIKASVSISYITVIHYNLQVLPEKLQHPDLNEAQRCLPDLQLITPTLCISKMAAVQQAPFFKIFRYTVGDFAPIVYMFIRLRCTKNCGPSEVKKNVIFTDNSHDLVHWCTLSLKRQLRGIHHLCPPLNPPLLQTIYFLMVCYPALKYLKRQKPVIIQSAFT